MLADLVRSALIVDIALLVVVTEAVALCLRAWWTGRRAPLRHLPHLAAGTCLLLALRVALLGGSPLLVLLALSGALAANLIDVRRRWRPDPPD